MNWSSMHDRVGLPRSTTRWLERWENGPDPGLARMVGCRYLWPQVARMIAEAYEALGG